MYGIGCTFIMFTALIAGDITNQDYEFGGCYSLTDIYNVCIIMPLAYQILCQ